MILSYSARQAKRLVKESVITSLASVATIMGSSSRRRDRILPPTTRAKFLKTIPMSGAVLELGPFDVPQMVGDRVAYFDVLDQGALRLRAVQEGRDPTGCPVIDYVSDCGDLSIVPGPFDTVFSAHVIEHQHDLIQHLADVHRLLKPGGRYYMVVPDKRYCFDHFLKLTTIEDVVAMTDQGPAANVERAIYDVYYNLAHNDCLKHWLGLHGERLTTPATAKAEYDTAIARYRDGYYRDVHACHFTPSSFQEILTTLYETDRSALRPIVVHDTHFADLEFFAVLEKS
jgi:SAM-dependent methyltransferase